MRTYITALAFVVVAPGGAHGQLPTSKAVELTAFRAGLSAAALPGSSDPVLTGPSQDFLQAITLRWAPYPGAEHYAVLRAASQNGPWVRDHLAARLIDTLHRMPPVTGIFVRVVALRSLNGSDVPVDSSNVVAVTTLAGRQSFTTPFNIVSCTGAGANAYRVVWHRAPNAAGYSLSGGIVGGPALAPVETADTTVTLTNVPGPQASYRIALRYDIPNWPAPGHTQSFSQNVGTGVRIDAATHQCR